MAWGNNSAPRWGSTGLGKSPSGGVSGGSSSKTPWGKGGLSSSRWGSSWGSENTLTKALSVCIRGRRKGIWG